MNEGYTLPLGVFEMTDINLMLKSLVPKEVNQKITNDDVRLKSKLTTNKTIKFTKKSFCYIILGVTQSLSGVLGDIDGFVQLLQGNYKINKPINVTGIDKYLLKCDCINGSIVNGVGEAKLYSFALSSFPGHTLFKEPKIKLFIKLNKPVLSQIIFYLEDDDYKPDDCNGETINFTCQLIEK